ncbi:MAG: hypothetical protein MNSN_10040 [Minisyncoccus archaeiphilus]|uniref:hypothetical protein n=1 Tax=Minisyncoccus archaeiphilus TaxID=3238481 RepID=UPI002B0C3AAF|nr:MAG: hypothetical protein MNSN_10040 [Candidatus Parcubacteria bacterium]
MFEIIYLSDPTDGDNLKTDPFFMERGLDLFDYYFLSLERMMHLMERMRYSIDKRRKLFRKL